MQSQGYHVGIATVGAAFRAGIALHVLILRFCNFLVLQQLIYLVYDPTNQYPTYARVTAVNANTVENKRSYHCNWIC